ncbi:hypothetical protein BDV3_004853 [Batrachochytrium dendrobatidis]
MPHQEAEGPIWTPPLHASILPSFAFARRARFESKGSSDSHGIGVFEQPYQPNANKDKNISLGPSHNKLELLSAENINRNCISSSHISSSLTQHAWVRDFPATCSYTPSCSKPIHAQSKLHKRQPPQTPPATRIVTLRIVIYPLTGKSFPQCHKLVITSPTEDVFFHWKFVCTPFSFATLVKDMNWEMPAATEGIFPQTFDGFGQFVRDRVLECVQYPNQFKALLEIDRFNTVASLNFTEVVRNYRRVDLLAIDFVPSEWQEVIRDIKADYARTKKYHGDIKSALVHVLDIVARHQPTLLLSPDFEPDVFPVRQPKHWTTVLDHYLPSVVNPTKTTFSRTITPSQRSTHTKAFVLTTLPDTMLPEAVYSKTVPVRIHHHEVDHSNEGKTEFLTFTFYTVGNVDIPEAYTIKVTKRDDAFFSFVSEEITPARFLEMMNNTMIEGNARKETKLGDPRWMTTAEDKQKGSRAWLASRSLQREREEKLGFHPFDGIGGVIGVIGGDYLCGIEEDPERQIWTNQLVENRYSAVFEVVKNTPNGLLKKAIKIGDARPATHHTHYNDHTAHITTTLKESFASQALNTSLPMETTRQNFESATLTLTERIRLCNTNLLTLKFTATPCEDLKSTISDAYIYIQDEIKLCKERLSSIMQVVKKRNPALGIVLEKVRFPNDEFNVSKVWIGSGGCNDHHRFVDEGRHEVIHYAKSDTDINEQTGHEDVMIKYAKCLKTRHMQRFDLPSCQQTRQIQSNRNPNLPSTNTLLVHQRPVVHAACKIPVHVSFSCAQQATSNLSKDVNLKSCKYSDLQLSKRQDVSSKIFSPLYSCKTKH